MHPRQHQDLHLMVIYKTCFQKGIDREVKELSYAYVTFFFLEGRWSGSNSDISGRIIKSGMGESTHTIPIHHISLLKWATNTSSLAFPFSLIPLPMMRAGWVNECERFISQHDFKSNVSKPENKDAFKWRPSGCSFELSNIMYLCASGTSNIIYAIP